MQSLIVLLGLNQCELNKMGITIYDSQRKIKSFQQIIREVWEKIDEDVINDSIRQR